MAPEPGKGRKNSQPDAVGADELVPQERQVASLELCRRLFELGAPRNTVWSWISGGVGEPLLWTTGRFDDPEKAQAMRTLFGTEWLAPAYSIPELLEIDPGLCITHRYAERDCIGTKARPRACSSWLDASALEVAAASGETAADAAANLLIRLIERDERWLQTCGER